MLYPVSQPGIIKRLPSISAEWQGMWRVQDVEILDIEKELKYEQHCGLSFAPHKHSSCADALGEQASLSFLQTKG